MAPGGSTRSARWTDAGRATRPARSQTARARLAARNQTARARLAARNQTARDPTGEERTPAASRDAGRRPWQSDGMSGNPRSPVHVADTGEAVDGRRLLAEAVGFGRALRSAGLQVDLGAAI